MESLICKAAAQSWTDEEIIQSVVAGETQFYELLVGRYNQRAYRAARAIVRDDAEAEDVMQEAHIAAFQHLAEFEGRASYSTWLTKIAIHRALARVKQIQRFEIISFAEEERTPGAEEETMTPEFATGSAETRQLLEQVILALPLQYRLVVMMRDVEEMSTSETANALQLTEEAVKVRLHRARALLRKELFVLAGATSTTAFQFHATRCDRITQAVMSHVLSQD